MKYKFILIFTLLLFPATIWAQNTTLVGIPGVSDPTVDLNTYINILYALAISLAALLAVIKIIIAGLKWMLSDVVTNKQEAKSDIWGATLGLLLIISSVLVLNTINPQLTKTSLFVAPVPASNNNASFVTKTALPSLNKGDTYSYKPASHSTICVAQEGGEWFHDGTSDEGVCVKRAEEAPSNSSNEVACLDADGKQIYDNAQGNGCLLTKEKCALDGGTAKNLEAQTGNFLSYKIYCDMQ